MQSLEIFKIAIIKRVFIIPLDLNCQGAYLIVALNMIHLMRG